MGVAPVVLDSPRRTGAPAHSQLWGTTTTSGSRAGGERMSSACCLVRGVVPRDPRPAWEAALVAKAHWTEASAWLLGRSLKGRARRGIGWCEHRPLAHQPGGAGAAGSWLPPLQFFARCVPSAGIMGGPVAANAVEEARRGSAGGPGGGRGAACRPGEGPWDPERPEKPDRKTKHWKVQGPDPRLGGNWSKMMMTRSSLSSRPLTHARGSVQAALLLA